MPKGDTHPRCYAALNSYASHKHIVACRDVERGTTTETLSSGGRLCACLHAGARPQFKRSNGRRRRRKCLQSKRAISWARRALLRKCAGTIAERHAKTEADGAAGPSRSRVLRIATLQAGAEQATSGKPPSLHKSLPCVHSTHACTHSRVMASAEGPQAFRRGGRARHIRSALWRRSGMPLRPRTAPIAGVAYATPWSSLRAMQRPSTTTSGWHRRALMRPAGFCLSCLLPRSVWVANPILQGPEVLKSSPTNWPNSGTRSLDLDSLGHARLQENDIFGPKN